MPYQREADAVIEDWREVEQDLLVVPRGTPEALKLNAEAERLRDEHQRLVEEGRRHHRAMEPFPTSASPSHQ